MNDPLKSTEILNISGFGRISGLVFVVISSKHDGKFT